MAKKKKKVSEFCAVETCTNYVLPGKEFCFLHDIISSMADKAQEAVQNGNILEGLWNSAASIFLESATPMVKPTLEAAAAKFTQSRPNSRPRRQAKADPWRVLGLNKEKATEKDVKAAQRHFADYYHPDKGNSAVNPEMIQYINAAADACLKDLQKR